MEILAFLGKIIDFLIFIVSFTTRGKPLWKRKSLRKEDVNIVFVDDQEFPVTEHLVKAGWSVTTLSDVENIQCEEIKRAHIIFVDYKGVGKGLAEKEEGIGIIKLLKNTYGKKKRIILYSSYDGFQTSPDWHVPDYVMSKNADAYQFITVIQSEMEKL